MSNIRLLIVEDDDALASLLQEYFLEADYNVTVHRRGDTALTALKSERFDLILTDLMLPGADGMSILHAASGAPEKTLVILMTGYSGIENALHAVQHGAYDFVSKPFQLPEIRVRLDNAARYQSLLRKSEAIKGVPARFVSVSEQSVLRAYDAHHAGAS